MTEKSQSQTEKSQSDGKRIISEMRYTEFPAYPLTRGLGFLGLHGRSMIEYFSYLLLEKS